MNPLLDSMSINTSAVRGDRIALALVVDEFADNPDVPHGAVYIVSDGTAEELGFFEFAIVSLAFSADGTELMALGEMGDVRVFSNGAVSVEDIEDPRATLRSATFSGGRFYAVGGRSRAFRRDGPGQWTPVPPHESLTDNYPMNHMEQVAAGPGGSLYAAGRVGVMWWFDGARWEAVELGTNLSLMAVSCGADGTVVAAGQGGILARGRENRFELTTPDTPVSDIWGVAEFEGKTYLAAMQGLLVHDGVSYAPDTEAMMLGRTFYDLTRDGDTLWSIGAKVVLRRRSGAWVRIDRAVAI